MWAHVRFLGTLPVLYAPSHTEISPGILLKVLNFEVFVPRTTDDLLIMQRGSWPDSVDAASFVIFVP